VPVRECECVSLSCVVRMYACVCVYVFYIFNLADVFGPFNLHVLCSLYEI